MSHLKTAYALGQQQAAAEFEEELRRKYAAWMTPSEDVFRPTPQPVSKAPQGGVERINFGRGEGSTVTAQPPKTERISFGRGEGSTVTAKPPRHEHIDFGRGEGLAMNRADVGRMGGPAQQPRLARIQGMPQTGAGGLIESGPLQINRAAPPASALAMKGRAPGGAQPPDMSAALAARTAKPRIDTGRGAMLADLGL